MKNLESLTALELGELIRRRAVSCEEAVRHCLEVMERREPRISAFLEISREKALSDAKEVQKRVDADDQTLSPLAGVPMALSDSICIRDLKTTGGSRMLQNFHPPYSATVWERLKTGGAVLLGKTALDEFGMGVSGETCAFGPARNVWDNRWALDGSVAAVAGGEAFYALGSDGTGALRRSAAMAGVSSLRPTWGTVSRYGVVSGTSSLEQVGVVGRTISDCAQVLALIRGRDHRDSTTSQVQLADERSSMQEMKIGLPDCYFHQEGMDPCIKERVLSAAKQLEGLGAVLFPVELPIVDLILPAYFAIACGEASSNLARYDGIRYGYSANDVENLQELYIQSRSRALGNQIKKYILLGNLFLSEKENCYNKALQVRELVVQGLDNLFDRCDMILSPVVPSIPLPMEEKPSQLLECYRQSAFTALANLAGLPAVTVPCGYHSEGLPISFQLIGKPYGEGKLLTVADAYQKTDGFSKTSGEVEA